MSFDTADQLLKARIDAVAAANQRTRIPVGLLTILSFSILCATVINSFGWNQPRIEQIDDQRREALRGGKCPCEFGRIQRYHKTLYNPPDHHDLSKKPLLESFYARRKACSGSEFAIWGLEQGEVAAFCSHVALEEMCMSELTGEHEQVSQQLIKGQTLRIPFIDQEISTGDLGTVGAAAICLLLSYLYASVRRAFHALAEFVTAERPRQPRIGGHIDLYLQEPLFSPAHYYVGYKSVAHTFVLTSSAPDPLLGTISVVLMLLPVTSILIDFALTGYQIANYYAGYSVGHAILRIALYAAFAGVALLLTYRSAKLSLQLSRALRAWAALMNAHVAHRLRKEASLTWEKCCPTGVQPVGVVLGSVPGVVQGEDPPARAL